MSKKARFIVTVIMIALILFLVGCGIYVLSVYGDKPISEIPTWAYWLIVR